MFHIVTGTMGGGKSFYAVKLVIDALKRGAYVHTNLPLNLDKIEEAGYDISKIIPLPDTLKEWFTLDPTCSPPRLETMFKHGAEGYENLVVVDEAGLYFFVDDATKDKEEKSALYKAIKWSRKEGLDYVFIEQNIDNLDAKTRRMAQLRIHCTAVKTMPLVGYLAERFLGQFKRSTYPIKSVNVPLAVSFARLDLKLASMYRTDDRTATQHSKEGRRTPAAKKGIPLDNLVFIIAAVVLVCLMVWSIWNIKNHVNNLGKKDEHKLESVGTNEKTPSEREVFPSPLPTTKPALLDGANNPSALSRASLGNSDGSNIPLPLPPMIVRGHEVKRENVRPLRANFSNSKAEFLTDDGWITLNSDIDGHPIAQIEKYGEGYLVLTYEPCWFLFTRTAKKNPATPEQEQQESASLWTVHHSSKQQQISPVSPSPVGSSVSSASGSRTSSQPLVSSMINKQPTDTTWLNEGTSREYKNWMTIGTAREKDSMQVKKTK